MQNAYEKPCYYVKKVMHTCKMLMIGAMELLTLEELSKKIKRNKERRKSKRRE
jgi:hypothetical protein